MDINFLEFERPIAELKAKIEELWHVGDDNESTSRRKSNGSKARARS